MKPLIAVAMATGAAVASFVLLTERRWSRMAALATAIVLATTALYFMLAISPTQPPPPVYE